MSNEKDNKPKIRLNSVMLDCDNPVILGTFYAQLLGGALEQMPYTDEYVCVNLADSPMTICCQKEPYYRRPVWPSRDNMEQQMMAHLDFKVSDLKKAIEYAESLGATVPEAQFCPEGWVQPWITLLDPAGHPFCMTEVE